MIIIPLLLSLLISTLCSSETTPQQATYNLILPANINTGKLKKYCSDIFLNNHVDQIHNFIKFVSKTYKKNDAREALGNISEWALKNKYHSTLSFVKAIPKRILSRNNNSLKSRIFVNALYEQHTDIVQYLLPLFTKKAIVTTKIEDKTFLEHAQSTNNQEAIISIQSTIKLYEKHLHFHKKFKQVGWTILKGCIALSIFSYIAEVIFVNLIIYSTPVGCSVLLP